MGILGLSGDFDVTDKLLIKYCVFVKYFRKKNGNKMWQCISYLQILRKPIIQPGRRSCTNLTVFVAPKKHKIIGGEKGYIVFV